MLQLTVYLPDGTFSVLEVETRDITLGQLMEMAMARRKKLSRIASNPRIKIEHFIEKKDKPGEPLDKVYSLLHNFSELSIITAYQHIYVVHIFFEIFIITLFNQC